jgi:hypothetical protein
MRFSPGNRLVKQLAWDRDCNRKLMVAPAPAGREIGNPDEFASQKLIRMKMRARRKRFHRASLAVQGAALMVALNP